MTGAERLMELLPAVHRLRDVEQGGVLEALLAVVDEQLRVVEDDVAQLYDDWFVETCAEWVVPYLGDLVGADPGSGRRAVGDAIGTRRRKGTRALLEELAADVAGWPARAVAFQELLALAQHVNHLHAHRGRTLDLRDGAALDRLGGPFDRAAHTVSVGRLGSRRRRTRYGIPDVGLFVWRLRPQSRTGADAFCVDPAPNRYTFSCLGNDAALLTRPLSEPGPEHVADDLSVPSPVRRRQLADRVADFYGPGKSLAIYAGEPGTLVPLAMIVAADLADWTYEPSDGRVAVDPERGRIAFDPDDDATGQGVWVSFREGFSADIGGGEYLRPLTPLDGRARYVVRAAGGDGAQRTIGKALRAWRDDQQAGRAGARALIEVDDSRVYGSGWRPEIRLRPGEDLEVRAAQGRRPVLLLGNERVNRLDALEVRAEREDGADAPPPRITFDGLVIGGRAVRVIGELSCVTFRHCTLVPGWTLDCDCEPVVDEPSVVLEGRPGSVLVQWSILGGIRVIADEVRSDPIPIALYDSILDATRPDGSALRGRDRRLAHVALTIARCTVFGEIGVHAVTLAENAIFADPLRVARRQLGCLCFCFVADGSRTPARSSCVPDAAHPGLRPAFDSRRYGTPDYARLAPECPAAIARGADDEGEQGAFHDLHVPRRADALTAALNELTPAGASAGILYAT
jgi:hypothetical protein